MNRTLPALLLLIASPGAWAFTVAIPSPVSQASSQIAAQFPLLTAPLDVASFPADILTGSTSGHEEITRQAMNRLEIHLSAAGLSLNRLSPEFLADRRVEIDGASGLVSKNMIIRGNYATDLPFGFVDEFDVPKWHGLPLQGWTGNANGQVLHFLQNRNPDGSLVSPRDTCRQARDEIVRTTAEGLRSWGAGNIKVALFLFGHATHTIQDSFSSAHTVRAAAADNHDLLNVCYYGPVLNVGPAACHHDVPDIRDDIWLENPIELLKKVSSAIPLDEIKERGIKAEARLARTATIRYLYLVSRILFDGKSQGVSAGDVKTLLDMRLFDGATGVLAIDQGLAKEDAAQPVPMPRGVMNCDRLGSTPLVPAVDGTDRTHADPYRGG
jgi:hypothetical protein